VLSIFYYGPGRRLRAVQLGNVALILWVDVTNKLLADGMGFRSNPSPCTHHILLCFCLRLYQFMTCLRKCTSTMPQSLDFDAAKWINNQQLYPGFNVPKDILYERRRLLCIPPYYHGLVPRSSISIQELIDSTSIPLYDRTLRPDPSFYFSSMRPDLDLPSDLASWTFPSVEITSMLLDSFGQQWFGGAMSFQDPRQPSHYLGPYVVV
jgi:hypothetical protein